ncbi:FTR1 family protein [Candidatus Woesearchaeota archaeon]|nr:FTR1 family protein [Candidatus Woesearchaeota archaeon]
MIESFLITSRETLEASLVVGIVMAYLNRTNNQQFKKSVYYGIIFGILISLLSAYFFMVIAGGFEGRTEELFEGITMLIGAFLLTTMILWMMKQRHVAQQIEAKVTKHIAHPTPLFSHVGIFLLIAIAVIREGVETVIFLNAINYASGISFIGGLLGIGIAVLVGYLFFMSTTKINLKKLFTISSVLLILFAAGLVAHGVHEFEEAGVLSGIITPVWDINPQVVGEGQYPLLHEKGAIGSFFKGLFGYNGNPSLLEVLSYATYLVLIFFLYLRIEQQQFPQKAEA